MRGNRDVGAAPSGNLHRGIHCRKSCDSACEPGRHGELRATVRDSLARWVRDADAVHHLDYFRVEADRDLAYIRRRAADYYLSLVGELFDYLREPMEEDREWDRLGNALACFGAEGDEAPFPTSGVSRTEANLFAACAFYCGGFPASAYVTVRTQQDPHVELGGAAAACFDLLGRPRTMRSEVGRELLGALRRGDMDRLAESWRAARDGAREALTMGPEAWIPARLLERLLQQFLQTNLRAVLPDGGSEFWTPLIVSLVDQNMWQFFPSQVEAIQRGLLDDTVAFALQMPTGAGKTALCETLMFRHVKSNDDAVAVLLVPYRSLASELRNTLVKRLNAMRISARCAYGGTVPTGDEVGDLDSVRVMVATPEALSGILSADPTFFHRISLVVCDEGHLLDSPGRGVSLELLLARMRAREGGAPRFVFVSAIVPNIEEINSWLGGTDASVVRSDYRPAVAEYAVLRASGGGSTTTVALELHPHEDEGTRYSIRQFLRQEDFYWTNAATHRRNTYKYTTIKAQAVAAARKALPMGAAALFAANKRGSQGAVGLAGELMAQLRCGLTLPEPISFANERSVHLAFEYLRAEYGDIWMGSEALRVGAVLHHGDIPQETREVLEGLLRSGDVRLAICTQTLAEGVNLPIRTLVLYSVERRGSTGRPERLLGRDIKNLVGRAGRAGSTTRGLVVCANPAQWQFVEPVARDHAGEPVGGALVALMRRLLGALARQRVTLSNELLESRPPLHALVDGVDATLIDLATEEVGEREFVGMARGLADETFASRKAELQRSRELLREVFALRAQRVVEIQRAGRLGWIRDTGTCARMVASVEGELLPQRERWDDVEGPLEERFVGTMLGWAWRQRELQVAVEKAYRLKSGEDTGRFREQFFDVVRLWISGAPFVEISRRTGLAVDDLLGVYTHVVGFALQTLIEQAVALLERLVGERGETVAEAVTEFPEHLRFGVGTAAGRVLAGRGLRHRRAAVEVGNVLTLRAVAGDRDAMTLAVRRELEQDPDGWSERLGVLVLRRTLEDLA